MNRRKFLKVGLSLAAFFSIPLPLPKPKATGGTLSSSPGVFVDNGLTSEINTWGDSIIIDEDLAINTGLKLIDYWGEPIDLRDFYSRMMDRFDDFDLMDCELPMAGMSLDRSGDGYCSVEMINGWWLARDAIIRIKNGTIYSRNYDKLYYAYQGQS